MGLPVTPPYVVFTGLDGTPVEDGFVYFGVANLDPQTNPITVYWDEAMANPAPQPIRTLDGYISRNGTPANVYTSGDYSVTVRDKNGNLIFTALTASQIAWANYAATLASNVYNGSGGSAQIGFIQAGSGAVARTMQDKAREFVTVEDFGAVGDGVTDDTAAIQLAINYVQAQNNSQMELRFDAKPYRCLNTLQVTGSVRFVGQGFFDLDNARGITRPTKGTWLIHGSTTGPLVTFTGNLGKCSGLFDIAIFQEGHSTPGPGWTPAVRDWVIRNDSTVGTLYLNRVHFHNVYQGVFTNFAVRPQYENITGQFFFRGFLFDQIYDIGKFDGLHAWTYWSEQNDVLQWTQANCVEITLLRVDGLWMDRIFTFAVESSIFIGLSSFGGSAKVIVINGLYSDFSGRALVVDSANPAHVQLSNVFHLGQAWPTASPPNPLPGSCVIDISSGSNHLIQVGNLYGTLSETHAIRVGGSFNTVWVGSSIFESYSRGSAGNGAVTASATNVITFATPPLLNPYAGGATTVVNGTPGGTVVSPTREITLAAYANRPVTQGNTTGQLTSYSAEGDADAGVVLLAKTTGVVQVASATNKLGFYGSLGDIKGAVTGAKGGNVALTNLLTYLAARGILTDSTT